MSTWGGEWTCGIGVATSDSPQGPFEDHGMLFRSNEIESEIVSILLHRRWRQKYLFLEVFMEFML